MATVKSNPQWPTRYDPSVTQVEMRCAVEQVSNASVPSIAVAADYITLLEAPRWSGIGCRRERLRVRPLAV